MHTLAALPLALAARAVPLETQPARLARIAPAAIGVARALFGRSSRAGDLTLRWMGVTSLAHPMPWLVCESPCGPMRVGALAAADGRRPDWRHDAPADHRLIELALELAPALDAIERATGVPLEPSMLDHAAPPAHAMLIGFDVVQSDGRTIGAGIVAPDKLDQWGPAFANVTTVATPQPGFDRLSVRLHVRAHGPALTRSALRALRHGDWIVLPPYDSDLDADLDTDRRTASMLAEVYAEEDAAICRGRVEPAGLRVQSLLDPRSRSHAMEPDDDKPGVAIDAVPIRLRFEVGTVMCSFAQLSTLAPGHVLPLERALDERAVSIYANGVRIGAGSLALLDTALCVRITELSRDGLQ